MKKLLLTLTLLLTLGFAASAYEDNILLEFLKNNWENNTSYTQTKTSKDGKWALVNFNNNNQGWKNPDNAEAFIVKCGRNKNNASIAQIQTAQPLEQAITKICVNIDAITTSSVNSVYLKIAEDNSFSNAQTISLSTPATGDNYFTIDEPTPGKCYSIVFDCKAGSANGFVAVKNVKYFYENQDETREVVELAWNTESATLNIGDSFEAPILSAKIDGIESAEALAAVEYTIDNEALLKYENGVFTLTPDMTGSATVTANIPADNESYLSLKPATYTVKVIDPNAGFILVTNASELYDGAEGYIVCGSYIMAAQNGTYRNAAELEIDAITEGVLTVVPENAAQIIFEKSGENFNLKVTDGYLYYNNSSNSVSTGTTLTEATISISENSDAQISLKSGRKLQFNSSANPKRFAFYTGTQQDVQIYIKPKKAEPEPSLVEESTFVKITHRWAPGIVNIDYTFEIANHNGNQVEVTATINGKEHITFTKVETPASAPAREVAANGNWIERGTLTASHEDLKGAPSLSVNVKATLDGKELYNVDHTNYTTTGIEDVTVEGNEAAEYFNLQGIRVAEPQAGQVYIVRRGAKTTKELVK